MLKVKEREREVHLYNKKKIQVMVISADEKMHLQLSEKRLRKVRHELRNQTTVKQNQKNIMYYLQRRIRNEKQIKIYNGKSTIKDKK